MVRFDSSIWKTYDPDEILSLDASEFNKRVIGFSQKIHPRQDLLQFTHESTNIIIDFGYYGDEDSVDGNWTVNVIDLNIDDPWNNQLEQYVFAYSDFLEAMKIVDTLVEKYT